MVGLLPQSLYSRLAGYEDTNDAERLSVDPAMRHVVGGPAPAARTPWRPRNGEKNPKSGRRNGGGHCTIAEHGPAA